MADWDDVAFRIELRGDPTAGALWDSGQWDTAEWVDPADDDAYDWTDVTDDYVAAVFTSARRPEFGGRFTPGTATVTLKDDDGDYTIGSASAVLSIGQVARIVAVHNSIEYVKFRGVVKVAPGVDSASKSPLVKVVLRSPLAAIARQNRVPRSPVGLNDLPKFRIDRILDSVLWPKSLRDIDIGKATRLQATTLEGSALAELQDVAIAEGGEIFHDDAGSIVFYDETGVAIAAAADPIFTAAGYADPGGVGVWIPWSTLAFVTDVDKVRNHVTIGAVGFDPVTVLDAASITRYGLAVINKVDLINTWDIFEVPPAWPAELAARLVATYKDPAEAYEFTLDSGVAASVVAVLGSSILDIVRVRRYVGGVEVDREAMISAIAYTIRPARPGANRTDQWTVKITTGLSE